MLLVVLRHPSHGLAVYIKARKKCQLSEVPPSLKGLPSTKKAIPPRIIPLLVNTKSNG
jgi:hypothetical protein